MSSCRRAVGPPGRRATGPGTPGVDCTLTAMRLSVLSKTTWTEAEDTAWPTPSYHGATGSREGGAGG